MKFSVSVPDDLWNAVHREGGPSETVQKALRILLSVEANRRPMSALDPDMAEQLRPRFEAAVKTAAEGVTRVVGNGYRLGLLVAPALTPSDFDAIDEGDAVEALRRLISGWGDSDEPEPLSFELASAIGDLLTASIADDPSDVGTEVNAILGYEDDPGAGVRWEAREVGPDGEGLMFPSVSRTFAEGVLEALRDVRDEAQRRIAAGGGDRQ